MTDAPFGRRRDVHARRRNPAAGCRRWNGSQTSFARRPREDIETVIAFLSGSPRQGRIGVGAAAIVAARDAPPAADAVARARGCRRRLRPDRVALGVGIGAGARRTRCGACSNGRPSTSRISSRGCCSASCGRARSKACWSRPLRARRTSGRRRVRRAAMLAGALAPVARAALVEGEAALTALVVQPFTPIQPMLADSADGIGAAIAGSRTRRRSSSSWMARGSRCTRRATRCACTRATCATSRAAVPEVVEAVRRARRRARSSSTARRSRSALTARRTRSRSRCAGSAASSTSTRFAGRCRSRRSSSTACISTATRSIDEPLGAPPRSRCAAVALAETCSCRASSRRTPRRRRRFCDRALAAGHEGVMAKALDGALRGRPPRRRVAQGQERPHARSRRARGRVGQRPAQGLAQQPAPRRARSATAAGSSCSARRSRG